MFLFDPRLLLGLALLFAATGASGRMFSSNDQSPLNYEVNGCAFGFEERGVSFTSMRIEVEGTFRLLGGEHENYQGVVISGSGRHHLGNRVRPLKPGEPFQLPAGAFLVQTGRQPLELRVVAHAMITPGMVVCR